MLVSDDEEALVGLEDHWKRRLNGALDVFRSEPYFLEVVPCAIDKANSLGALLEVLDVKREEVALRAFPYLLAMWLLIIVVAACPDFVMFLPRLLM